MAPRSCLLALLACLACAAPPPAPPPSTREPLDEAFGLAELILLGQVQQIRREPRGRFALVEIRELLTDRKAKPDSTPRFRPGDVLRLSSHLYRPGLSMTSVDPLTPGQTYLFHVSPAAQRDEWLHLLNSSEFALPEAYPQVNRLRERLAN